MTRFRTWISGLFLLSCVAVVNAQGQEHGVTKAGVDSLHIIVGDRIRLTTTASSRWQVGTLGSVNNETLILHGREDTRIPTQSLVAVQRSLGRARFNPTFAGFAIGLVAGGAAGFAVGNANRPSGQPNGSQRSVGLAIGGAVGAGLGALIGAAIAPEHWRDVRLR